MVLGKETLPLPTPPKLASLLACLLLHRDQPILRHQISGWLWPGETESEARANLRRHLHLLRQSLPPGEWALAERDTIQWNPAADYWLDVAEFTRNAARNTDPNPNRAYEACLELYQGDLLPELYDDWLIPERENLRRLFAQILEAAIAFHAGERDYPSAIRAAQHLLVFDPLHEETHRMLMRLYILSGDRQAALQQFEKCQELLRRELNVEPMPATRELHRAILEGRPLPDATMMPAWSVAPPAGAATLADLPIAASPAPGRRRLLLLALAAAAMVVLALAALTWIFLPSSSPESFVIAGPANVKDTWITEQYPNDLYWPEDPDRTPYEKYSRVHLQFYKPRPPDRVVIQFDLGQFPATAQVTQAAFQIHLETWIELEVAGALTQSYPAQVSVFQILTPWRAEMTTFSQPWTQPGLQPGVDFNADPLDTQVITATAWLKFDVTEAVLDWLRDPQTNHGLMIEITSAPEDIAHYWVDLTDQGAAILRPYLQISYRKR